MNRRRLRASVAVAQSAGSSYRYQHSAFVRADFIGNAIISRCGELARAQVRLRCSGLTRTYVCARYPIRSSKAITLDVPKAFQRGAVLAEIEAPHGLFTIICLHLDHMREPERQEQMAILFREIENVLLPDGFVLCGDFNALHRNDYSDEEWQAIADVRAGQWEPPMQDLMADLINTRGFVDSLRESAGLPNDSVLSGIDATCRQVASLRPSSNAALMSLTRSQHV